MLDNYIETISQDFIKEANHELIGEANTFKQREIKIIMMDFLNEFEEARTKDTKPINDFFIHYLIDKYIKRLEMFYGELIIELFIKKAQGILNGYYHTQIQKSIDRQKRIK